MATCSAKHMVFKADFQNVPIRRGSHRVPTAPTVLTPTTLPTASAVPAVPTVPVAEGPRLS